MKRILILGLALVLVMGIAVGCTPKVEDQTYEDGVHTVEGEFDEQGWKGIMEMTIVNGAITEVNYDEVNEEGQLKSEDEDYAEAMKGVSNITPKEAYEKLEASLLDTQNADTVEMVSGATGTSEVFKELANKALNK